MKNNKPQQSNNIWPVVIIIVAGLILFFPLTKCDFLSNWDDGQYVVDNPDIRGFSAQNIGKVFSTFYVNNYQPVSMMSYMIDFTLGGLKPGIFHFINILLHLINAVLVYIFIYRLIALRPGAFFCSIVFLIHPMHLESVAWISERKDVLYGLFVLLALISYLQYIDNNDKRKFFISFLFFVLAVLSKSMALTLPFLLFAVDYYRKRKFSKELIIEKIPFLILSAIFIYITILTQSENALNSAPQLSAIPWILMVIYAIGYYLLMFIFPFHLSVIHYYPVDVLNGAIPYYLWIIPVALLLTGYLLWTSKEHRRIIIFGLAFFLVSLSIVLQILPFGLAITAERYTYLAYIGLSVPVAVWLFSRPRSSIVRYVIFIFFLGYFVLTTGKRIPVWKNSVLLFADGTKKYPAHSHAYWCLATAQSDYKLKREALSSLNYAIRLNPHDENAFFSRATIKSDLNDLPGSLADYDTVLMLNSRDTGAYINKGNIYFGLQKLDSAIIQYNRALTVNHSLIIPRAMKGLALVNGRRYTEAEAVLDTVIMMRPAHANALYYRGVARYNLQKLDSACADWKRSAVLGQKDAAGMLLAYCRQ